MAEEEGFLNRWSRRKLAEKEPGDKPEEAEAAPSEEGEAVAAAPGEAAEEEARERHPAEDIDIDTLTAESDFKIFLQAGVPAAVKRKALRKLWTTDPVIFGRDPVNDDFDITDTKTWGLGPPRGSSWQFGRWAEKVKDELKQPGDADDGDMADKVAEAEPAPPEQPLEEGDAGEQPAETAELEPEPEEEPSGHGA